MEEITIDIDLDGGITVEGKGFTGAECKLATQEIERALGTVERVTKKPEYHRQKANTKAAAR